MDTGNEVKNEKKIKKSAMIKTLIGLLFVIAGGIILFVNEGQIITKKMKVKERNARVISISADQVEPQNNNKLVYLAGMASPQGFLKDEDFGIEVNSIYLNRIVEIFQWIEKTDIVKDAKEETHTVISYHKEWKSGLINYKAFNDTTGHINPLRIEYPSKVMISDKVFIGKYELDRVFVNQIITKDPLKLKKINPVKEPEKTQLSGNIIYIVKGSPQTPEIGDIRISYLTVKPQKVSVIGRQTGNRVETFLTANKSKINLLEPGIVSPKTMFTKEEKTKYPISLIFRLMSYVFVLAGFLILYKPFIANRGYFGFIKRVTTQGLFKQSVLLSLLIFTIVLASTWILYAPLTGIISYIIALIALILLFIKPVKKITDNSQLT